jgi:hypothetical protein
LIRAIFRSRIGRAIEIGLEFAHDLARAVFDDRMRKRLGVDHLEHAMWALHDTAVYAREDAHAALNRATSLRSEMRAEFKKLDGRVPEVPPGGWKVGEGFMFGVGTVRTCIDCGCLVGGGPTRCNRCANEVA